MKHLFILFAAIFFIIAIASGSKNEAWYDNQLKKVGDTVHGIKLSILAHRLKLDNPVVIRKPISPDPFYWAVYTTSTLRVCLAAHDNYGLITNLSLLEYAYSYTISTNKFTTNVAESIPPSWLTKRDCIKPYWSKTYCCPFNFSDVTNKYVSYFNHLTLCNTVTIKKIEKDLKLPRHLETSGGCILDPKWAIVYYTNSTLIVLGANQISERALRDNSTSNFVFNGYWSVRSNFKLP